MMATATLRYIMRDPSTQSHKRGVAQPGSAPPWGGGGRRFKSSRPDQYRVFVPFEAVIPFTGSRSLATVLCRAGCARVFTCGWLTHGRLLFFACAKKSNQKKHTPERAKASSVPRPTGRSTNSPGAGKRASGSNTVSLESSRWGCGTRRALRGSQKTN